MIIYLHYSRANALAVVLFSQYLSVPLLFIIQAEKSCKYAELVAFEFKRTNELPSQRCYSRWIDSVQLFYTFFGWRSLTSRSCIKALNSTCMFTFGYVSKKNSYENSKLVISHICSSFLCLVAYLTLFLT